MKLWKKVLAIAEPGEIFYFLNVRWDIWEAWKICQDGRPLYTLDENEIDYFYNMISNRPDIPEDILVMGKPVNFEYAKTTDVNTPGLMAWFPEANGYFLIDGWHRLANCKMKGIKQFSVYVLTKEESKEVRL